MLRPLLALLPVPLLLVALVDAAGGHSLPVPGRLSDVELPPVPGLVDGKRPLLVDGDVAVVLGKALFWDQNVGSDGMACASCHFHAGADARVRNALAPGELREGAASARTFEPLPSGAPGGPNHTLSLADFPLLQLLDPLDRSSDPLYVTDDVVSSAGTFGGDFVDSLDRTSELCGGGEDDVFQRGGVRTRRVEPRHTPSVVNAVFFRRQFLDGRASSTFNGRSHLGERDRTARVFVGRGKKARPKRLWLENASLASQAVAPPLDTLEMSCAGRSFPAVARKLLGERPLADQEVHPDDGVLGAWIHASGLGLDTTYRALIERAFHPSYWSSVRGRFPTAPDGSGYDHMESNFSVFFGIALQLYQATLISDESPFDLSERNAQGVPLDLPEAALRGLDLFMGKAHCIDCHRGAEFSAAATSQMLSPQLVPRHPGPHRVGGPSSVDRVALASGVLALIDRGFANTGVAPAAHDPGLGGADPEGHPWSLAAQYAGYLAGEKPVDKGAVQQVSGCDFEHPFGRDFDDRELRRGPVTDTCGANFLAEVPKRKVARREAAAPGGGRLAASTVGAFKIPTLRNVELTGPYMHNGSMATLRQVIDFYSRGGNFDELSQPGLAGFVFASFLDEGEKADLEAFLRTLTDERVRFERAPFDHPSLRIPDGHPESGGVLEEGSLPGREVPLAADAFLELPAVGRDGRTPEQGPLLPLEARIGP